VRFQGRKAFVTGGGSGIGLAVCRALAREGATVAVADNNADRASAVAAELSGGCLAVELDVSDGPAVCLAVDEVARRLGGLDLAVNSAGIAGTLAPLADYDPDVWRSVLDVNLTGVFHCLQAEVRNMLEGSGGAIVNVASIHGLVGHPCHAAYVAAKHGVVGLTKVAALDYAALGVRVNAVAPAYIQTPMSAAALQNPDKAAAAVAQHPVGRLGQAEEVAALVCFLLSDEASFLHGGTHLVDGGYTAR
jgi:NAD(P)-dependent dehydrogenase (short-subunit alcohol dehydrogenase family)